MSVASSTPFGRLHLALGGFAAYLLLVRALRYRRIRSIQRYFAQCRDGKGSMTVEQAQRIIIPLFCYEMPLLMRYSLAFALFKTYGIPSISSILKKTGELSSSAGISRRYADACLSFPTWMFCPLQGFFNETSSPGFVGHPTAFPKQGIENPPDDNMIHRVSDPRANISIARTNWLHSRYNISNDDMLYTLALFVFEPVTWAKKWGWRDLTGLERQAGQAMFFLSPHGLALWVLWKDVGTRMGIEAIPDSLVDFEAWAKTYERTSMLPAESNREVADYTLAELLHVVPNAFGIKAFAKRVAYAVLEPRVRIAMLYPEQPWYIHALLAGIMGIHKYGSRWLALPKVWPTVFTDNKTPWRGLETRFHPSRYQPTPWYKPETSGWLNPFDWANRLAVVIGFYKERPSGRLSSQGYRLDIQGPVALESSGIQETLKGADQLLRFGCPIGKSNAPQRENL
ncbi:hypothetical protein DL96DRAFT_1522092 [Flagelloscypha sp. PMI_526]|nr:hypothetical protein DL96DRAFT_1522092 [Flagelloscypha sp. PMI_526]